MSRLATTKMSSKGQVVIPENVRHELGLESGAQFVVIAENDVIILKSISPPSMSEFSELIAKARKQAKKAGLTKRDIKDAIKIVRQKK